MAHPNGDHPAGGSSVFHPRSRGDTIPPRADLSSQNTSMFIALASSELLLGTGSRSGATTAPALQFPSDDSYRSPPFVKTMFTELTVDAILGRILCGAAAAHDTLVDRSGSVGPSPILLTLRKVGHSWCVVRSCTSADKMRLIAFSLLLHPHRRWAVRIGAAWVTWCPVERTLWRANAGSLVRSLGFRVSQDVDVAEYVCSCQNCQSSQSTKAEHRVELLNLLLIPSRWIRS